MADFEGRLTRQAYQAGHLVLPPAAVRDLELPEHRSDLTVVVDGEEVSCGWDPSNRILFGDALRDEIQLQAEPGDLFKLTGSAEELRLRFSHPQASVLGHRSSFDVRPISDPTPPRRRRLQVQRFRNRSDDEFVWTGAIGFHKSTINQFVENLDAGGWDKRSLFDLRIDGEKLAVVNTFDELLALGMANVDHMDHQIAAATHVLGPMRGRAVLADEVGLGKTIEAGLILKELTVRGMVTKVLILCPRSLRDQWALELEEKFDEPFEIVENRRQAMTTTGDRLIMSLNLARGTNNDRRIPERLQSRQWDLLIVDEAHKEIKGRVTRRLLEGINDRFRLFLTATPVQNRLDEIYPLVELIRPGTFQSERDFNRQFVLRSSPQNPRNPDALRTLLRNVMVRTTRAQAGLDNVQRYANDVPVTLSPPERRAYEFVVDVLRSVMNGPQDHMRRRVLARRLTASPRSLLKSARRIAQNHSDPRVREVLGDLADLALEFPITNRQLGLVEICRRWVNDDEKGKVLVFSQETDTVQDLLRILEEHDFTTVGYHGQLSRGAQRETTERFKDEAQIMVSTDAGAEGLNLQFANCVVNYDLPWNPMRIEQRIGRVHRVTQTRDVYVANLFARNTIDEDIYRILKDKLRMFELLFGQVTTIIGELDESFEHSIMSALTGSTSDSDLADRLATLGDHVGVVRERARESLESSGHLAWLSPHAGTQGFQEASDLKPDLAVKPGGLERSAEEFARRYLSLSGAEILYETDKFITASLPPDLQSEFDVERLHLAFSAEALNEHPSAELFVVGSELFEEFLVAIRERGDLLAEVPVLPTFGASSEVEAEPNIEFVERRILGPELGAVEATWRTSDDQLTGNDRIVSTWYKQREPDWETVEYEDLQVGSHISETTLDPEHLVRELQAAALPELTAVVEGLESDLEERHKSEKSRQIKALERQIETLETQRDRYAGWDDRWRPLNDQVQQRKDAWASIRQTQTPTVKLMADLLALRVIGSPVIKIEETWAQAGEPFIVAAELDLRTNTWRHFSADGEEISHLTICVGQHPIDLARTRCCPTCNEVVCELCKARNDFGSCTLCELEVCRRCLPPAQRQQPKPLCQACRKPVRAEDLDTDYLIGFRLGGKCTLLVGEREAHLDWQDGQPTQVVVPDEDVEDESRRILRNFAQEHGYPLSIGAVALDYQTPDASPTILLSTETVQGASWEIQSDAGSKSELAAAKSLTVVDGPGPDVYTETGSGIKEVLDKCRTETVPRIPSVIVSRVAHIDALELTPTGLRSSLTRVDALGSPELLSEQVYPFQPVEDDEEPGSVLCSAVAENATVCIRRLNHSFLLETSGCVPRFVPSSIDCDYPTEMIWAEALRSHGIYNGRVWASDTDPPDLEGRLAEPSLPVCNRRSIVERFVLTAGKADSRAADPSAQGFGGLVDARSMDPANDELSAVVLAVADTMATAIDVTTEPALEVEEQWHDLHVAELNYLVSSSPPLEIPAGVTWIGPGETLAPNDSEGRPLSDFEIDWYGNIRQAADRPPDNWSPPDLLHARHLRTRMSRNDDEEVIVLAGSHRREVAKVRISTGEVTSWEHRGPQPIAEQRLALAVIDHLGLDSSELDIRVTNSTGETSNLPPSAHLISRDSHHLVSASVTMPNGDIIDVGTGTTTVPIQDTQVLLVQARGVLGLEELPRRATEMEPDPNIDRAFTQIADNAPPVPVLHLNQSTGHELIWVDAEGLHRSQTATTQPEVHSESWHTDLVPDWMTEPLAHPPREALIAKLDTTSAGLIRQGDFVVLSTRHRSTSRWTRLSGDLVTAFMQATAGKELLGPGQLAEVTRVPDAEKFVSPTLTNAEYTNRSIALTTEPDNGPVDPSLTLETVLNLFEGRHLLPSFSFGDGDDTPVPLDSFLNEIDIHAARPLTELAKSELEDTTKRVAVVLAVTETWMSGNSPLEISYTIRPGEIQGHVLCHQSGRQVTEAAVDRSGHLVHETASCPYCDTLACTKCAEPVVSCAVCEIRVCGRCSAPDDARTASHLCPACKSLRPVGPFRRFRLKDLVEANQRAWFGKDDQHKVCVTKRSGEWVLANLDDHSGDNSDHEPGVLRPMNPDGCAVLNELGA